MKKEKQGKSRIVEVRKPTKNGVRHARGPKVSKGRGRLENRGLRRIAAQSSRRSHMIAHGRKYTRELANPPKSDRSPYAKALREARKQQPDQARILRLLRQALRGGDARSAWALYTWSRDGITVPKDMRKAIQLVRVAADKDLPEALYDLAVHHERGLGVKKNLHLAFELYLRAALQGDADAIYEVGRCYHYGIGVARDRKTAKLWLDRADQLGAA